MKKKNEFLKMNETASYLGVSAQTVRNLHSRGELIPARVTSTGRRLYTTEQLDVYIKERMECRE